MLSPQYCVWEMDKAKVSVPEKESRLLSFDFTHDMGCTQNELRLSSNPLFQHLLEGLAVLRKLLDALMKLVEGHLVL